MTSTAAPTRSLRTDASASAVAAGFIAVAISYAGPLLVTLEAARAAKLSLPLTSSWVWAISVGSGLVCFVLSWLTRQPVMVAWSIPGAALLITMLGQFAFSDAVGAFLVCGLVSALLGVTGLFGRLIAAVPKPVTAAVLAGVLFPFAIKVAQAVVQTPVVAGGLVLGYIVGRRLNPRYAVFLAMAVGGALALATGAANPLAVRFGVTVPVWTMPTFTLPAMLGLALPLLIVMHNSGYDADDRLLLGVSGLASALFAPFGAHQLNMAAVTAAIATSAESNPDRDRRYIAGMSCGVFYILGGSASDFIVSLFSAIPPGMITALAGVALLSPLQNSLYDTMHEGRHQVCVVEAAMITLAVTVSGIQPLGIVSAFWGLLAGVIAYAILRRPSARPRNSRQRGTSPAA